MKKVSLCLMLSILFLLTGCLCDNYYIELPNNFKLNSTCSVEDTCSSIFSENINKESHISQHVTEIDWDDRYIIAKQYKKNMVIDDKRNMTVIIDGTPNYWILDTEEDRTYGPYKDKKEFNQKKKELGIEKLKLKKTSDLEKYKKVSI